jgi:cell division protein FtsL
MIVVIIFYAGKGTVEHNVMVRQISCITVIVKMFSRVVVITVIIVALGCSQLDAKNITTDVVCGKELIPS